MNFVNLGLWKMRDNPADNNNNNNRLYFKMVTHLAITNLP